MPDDVDLDDDEFVDESRLEQVRQHLAEVEVNLVDAVIFDDNGHCWSMHELTSGTTRWG
jgi:hypothetical protein